MMKILLFIDSLGAGGAQRQMVGLASLLKVKGYDVAVACYYDIPFYVDQLQVKGVPYVLLKKAQNSMFRIGYVARYIRKTKPDVVIAYLETPSICACVSKLFNHKFKLLVSERNTTQHTGFNEKIRFRLFQLADYVVPNAFSQEDYIRKTFPRLAPKVVTIPNFVDLDFFVPPANRLRRETPEVLVVATIRASKNTLGFIDAVAMLKQKGIQFHISWYGKDESQINYFEQCQQKIKKLGVESHIELKEKTTKIRDIYQDADCFCLPSFYEGTPNVICEAMACGLPVLCSDVCDNSKYVEEGVNGFLFYPKETDTIVAAFERMFALTEKEYDTFCRCSRERAEHKLSKETFVKEYSRLIEQ